MGVASDELEQQVLETLNFYLNSVPNGAEEAPAIKDHILDTIHDNGWRIVKLERAQRLTESLGEGLGLFRRVETYRIVEEA